MISATPTATAIESANNNERSIFSSPACRQAACGEEKILARITLLSVKKLWPWEF